MRSISKVLLTCSLTLLARAGCGAEPESHAAQSDSSPRPTMTVRKFPISVGGRIVNGDLAEPDKNRLAADPALLLTFAVTRQEALHTSPHDEPAKVFIAAGHRVLSFDLPEHGDRSVSTRANGIDGMREAFLAGDDPFTRFVAEGKAAVDTAVERRLARPHRICVCGVSRAAYCALRLAAADSRIGGVAGLAPVTDWRALREFATVRQRPDVAALALENYAAGLAGRPVYLAIGNCDGRVGTECCARFALRLTAEESRKGIARSRLQFHVVDDSPEHSLALRWRREGAEFLLRLVH